MGTFLSGVVVGRISMEQISVRTDHGTTMSLRVHPDVAARLDLGSRAVIELDQSGRAESIRPARRQQST